MTPPPPKPDASDETDLLARYRDGDPTAFRQLVQSWQDRLLHFFFRLCWDRDRAEDLTQELFLKLMQASRRYRPEGRLSTYVYRVATNLWIDHYRAQRPQPRLYSIDQAIAGPAMEPAGPGESPLEHASGEEEKQRLRAALERLTEPHRIVFELAVYQQRPYAEIAELLGIPVGTVKSRMHNTVAALRELLAGGEGREQRSVREGS